MASIKKKVAFIIIAIFAILILGLIIKSAMSFPSVGIGSITEPRIKSCIAHPMVRDYLAVKKQDSGDILVFSVTKTDNTHSRLITSNKRIEKCGIII